MRTLLIANRGEIARRVIRTARARGVTCVALYTDADAGAPHVREADRALRVPSYLDVEAVVAAARECGADAVHPGYGFLSERAVFARALEEAGITLVGPPAAVMDALGRKDAAREVATAAGVPVVPSYDVDEDPRGMRLPVLVKAAAGGGGKGMRVVRTPEEYADAVASARREAAGAFGDDTLLVERYVERGRHIEVQVLADTHGTVLHFFERDCSTQRRHQKVLEEAPAPTLSEEQRRAVTRAGVDLAREAGYRNAGTVEFLLDADTGEFFFLEMNTRLQVEHPVTELVTGHDLVALQLDVADGLPLPLSQDDVRLHGHAIEARVYAEDSFGGFLPQAGTADLVRWPTGEHVRVDEALESGQVVSTSYDPMLGKVIAWGPDRETARHRLVGALDETTVLGLTTNTGFLRALVAGAEFRDATIDTAWLDRTPVPAPSEDVARVLAAWAQARALSAGAAHPFGPDGFRLGAPASPMVIDLDVEARVDLAGGRVDDHEVRELGPGLLAVDGQRTPLAADVRPHRVEVAWRGQRFVFERPDVMGDHGPAAGDGTLLAPMPGTVLDVRVEEGQQVSEGETLGVLEAMKMEVALRAPYDGTVTAVGAAAGDQVPLGHVLFEVSTYE